MGAGVNLFAVRDLVISRDNHVSNGHAMMDVFYFVYRFSSLFYRQHHRTENGKNGFRSEKKQQLYLDLLRAQTRIVIGKRDLIVFAPLDIITNEIVSLGVIGIKQTQRIRSNLLVM